MTRLTFDLCADYFRIAAAALPSADDDRPAISGVRLEPSKCGGVMMIATDGQILMAIRDRDGSVSRPATIRLPSELVKAARDARRGRGQFAKITAPRPRFRCIGDGRASLLPADEVSGAVHEIDRPYPDWTSIVRGVDRKARGVGSIRAETLGRVHQAGQILGPTARAALHPYGSHVVATFAGQADLFGVIRVQEEEERAFPPMWTLREQTA